MDVDELPPDKPIGVICAAPSPRLPITGRVVLQIVSKLP
jgi:hypothetical protein